MGAIHISVSCKLTLAPNVRNGKPPRPCTGMGAIRLHSCLAIGRWGVGARVLIFGLMGVCSIWWPTPPYAGQSRVEEPRHILNAPPASRSRKTVTPRNNRRSDEVGKCERGGAPTP